MNMCRKSQLTPRKSLLYDENNINLLIIIAQPNKFIIMRFQNYKIGNIVYVYKV